MNVNRAMLPSTTVYVNNNHVTFPSNAHHAQVVPTNELGNHSGGGIPGYYLSSPLSSALNDNRAMLPSTTVYVNNNHVTFPSNVHYAQVVPTVELGNHTGEGLGQYSYVPTAVAAQESYNTVNKNYE
jgi:pyridoxal/pyridoxine/pyridoxamine kinase